jgi:hypothetical protein
MGFALAFAGYALSKHVRGDNLRLSRQGGQPDRVAEHRGTEGHGGH